MAANTMNAIRHRADPYLPGDRIVRRRKLDTHLLSSILDCVLLPVCVLAIPVLLAGVFLALPMLALAMISRPDAGVLLLMAAIVGGLIGSLGLIRARLHKAHTSTAHTSTAHTSTAHTSMARIEATEVMLMIGVVTALGLLIASLLAAMIVGTTLALIAAGAFAVIVADSVRQLLRMLHLRAESCGQPLDALPHVFLGVGLSLVACMLAASM